MAQTQHNEISRKFVHFFSLLFPVLTPFSLLAAQIILTVAFIFYWFSEWQKLKGKKFFFHRWIYALQRADEKEIFARAPLFLALGVFGAITFFSWKAQVIGIYQVGFCDSVAALCGKQWGKKLLPFSHRKTYVGTIAYFIAALPVAFLYLPAPQALMIALLGAFLESVPVKDWDNFTIPIFISMVAENFLYGMG